MGEAASARPLSVTIPAIGAVVVGILGGAFALRFFVMSVGLMAGQAVGVRDYLSAAAMIFVPTLWGGTLVYAGLHTLRGDRMARLLLVGVLGLTALPGLAMFFILPLFTLALGCIAGIIALLHPESRAWSAPRPVKISPE